MSSSGRNQVIDGWRGLSVLLVIAGHATGYRLGDSTSVGPLHDVLNDPLALAINILVRLIEPAGTIGVDFFFVISGYLITSLLIAEEQRNGKVSILAFYVRRIFRIMPAFYAYILTVAVLSFLGLIVAGSEAILRSGLYVCNVSGYKCSWWLAHTWSLSVEEQFYLFWPLAFVLFGKARKRVLAPITIVLFAGSYWQENFASFGHIATGALVATFPEIRRFIERYVNTPVVLVLLAAVILQPLAYPLPFLSEALYLLKPIAISGVLFGTLFNGAGGPALALVETRFLSRVGLVSYSLYLWQQLSLAPSTWGGQATGAGALYESAPLLISLIFVPAAVISYLFLERPLIRIGHRLSNRILYERARKAAG